MTTDREITSRLQIFLPTKKQEPVAFRPAVWRRWVGHDPVADDLLRELSTEGRDQIDRDDLRRMAQIGDAQYPSTYLRLFIAVMVWGSGTTNGRAPRYTDMALRSRPGPVLEETAAL